MTVLGHVNYWFVVLLMMVGFYILISRGNLVKKLLGLSLFQTSVFIFYISLGKIRGGTAPILIGGHGEEEAHGAAEAAGHGGEAAGHAGDALAGAAGQAADTLAAAGSALADAAGQAAEHAAGAAGEVIYSNPLPHVLILTAIVVGIATTAVGLSLVIRINETYGTIEEDEIHDMDESL